MNNKNAVTLLILSTIPIPFSTLPNFVIPLRLTYAVIIFIVFFSLSFYKLINDFKFESKYFKFIFSLFLLYELSIVVRGWPFSTDTLKELLWVNYLFLPFVVPLFVYFDKSFSTLAYLLKNSYYLCLVFLIICLFLPKMVFTRDYAEQVISTFAIGSGFLMMNGKYISNTKLNVSFFVAFISLLSLIFLARRNGIVTFGGFIVAGWFLNDSNRSKTILIRIFPLIIGVVVVVLLSFPNLTNSLTKKLSGRLLEDTRSDVFEMYFIDMKDHMLFGKGLNGSYYFPTGGDLMDDGVTRTDVVDNRNIIENGILQLTLNGGIIHVVLFFLVLIPASINGIFQSSNLFTKACGAFILLWLIDMFVYGLPAFGLHYILVWISVGICYKSSIRTKTDDEIKYEFQKYLVI